MREGSESSREIMACVLIALLKWENIGAELGGGNSGEYDVNIAPTS